MDVKTTSVLLAAVALVANGTVQAQDLSCNSTGTNIVNFPTGELPFPDSHQITDEFEGDGLLFSDDDSDLPPGYTSLGAQENIINSGSFINPFRVEFLAKSEVYSVSFTLVDHNIHPQSHKLTAFNEFGEVLDDTFFLDFPQPFPGEPYPTEVTLTVSSCEGIAFVVATESPPGATRVRRIIYLTERSK